MAPTAEAGAAGPYVNYAYWIKDYQYKWISPSSHLAERPRSLTAQLPLGYPSKADYALPHPADSQFRIEGLTWASWGERATATGRLYALSGNAAGYPVRLTLRNPVRCAPGFRIYQRSKITYLPDPLLQPPNPRPADLGAPGCRIAFIKQREEVADGPRRPVPGLIDGKPKYPTALLTGKKTPGYDFERGRWRGWGTERARHRGKVLYSRERRDGTFRVTRRRAWLAMRKPRYCPTAGAIAYLRLKLTYRSRNGKAKRKRRASYRSHCHRRRGLVL